MLFGAGLSYAYLSPSFGPGVGALGAALSSLAISLVVNRLIDGLGHRRRNGQVVRSALTHSVFTAPAWGLGSVYAMWLALSWPGLWGHALEVPVLVAGALAACSHLLLDSLTEGGVFFTTKRVALAHFRSRNVLLNGVFVVLGLAFFAL